MIFNDKVVVVTGSSSGIGRAVAVRFATAGARVVVNCKSNIAGANYAVAEILALGREAIALQADVADPGQAAALFDRAVEAFGGVDILINNAGAATGKSFQDSTRDDWLAALDDNLLSAVWCCQRAAPLMKARGGGAIVNTASIRGLENAGRAGLMAYSAAKAALVSFTKTLARELAPSITVNAVAPGFIRTRNYDHMPEAQVAGFLDETLLGRFIEVDELAETYLYLAGTPVITGQVVVVDGGYVLK